MSVTTSQADDAPKSIFRKVFERFYHVIIGSDYEIIKLGNAAFLGLSALLLFYQPGYLESSPTLAQLLRWLPQNAWAGIMFFVGFMEFVLFIITGNPPMFSKGENDIVRWLWKSAGGFWVCTVLYVFFALMLTPPDFRFGLGNIVYGLAAFGSLLGALRSGDAIKQQIRRTSKTVQAELYAAAVVGTAPHLF